MSYPSPLRVRQIELENIACFERYRCDFHPNCTLLVGENASGKTALLEVLGRSLLVIPKLAKGIDYFFHDNEAPNPRRILEEVNGLVMAREPQPVSAGIRLWDLEPDSPFRPLVELGKVDRLLRPERFQELNHRINAGELIDLPVIAFYPTNRLWTGQADKEDNTLGSRLDAYDQCVPATRSLRTTATWMRRLAYSALQHGQPSPLLNAISQAVCTAVPEITAFWYEVRFEDLHVRFHDGRQQPYSQLSDGYKSLIGLVADLAQRASSLNPHLGADAALKVGGVVLIDELELHLHPRWQRRVLPDLMRAFPQVQFIATTHSPQVLASARREWVRLLVGGTEAVKAGPLEGRDSNAILADIMGDRSRPEAMQERLDRLFDLIDNESWAEARALLHELEDPLGASDTALVRARLMLHGKG